MRKNKGKIISIFLITLSVILIGINSYAHSGRTDSSGGHKDNKNKSGLGSYHYHCGGHPAHLHTNGVCPYSSKSSSNSSSSSKNTKSNSTSSSSKTTSTKSTTVSANSIQINEEIIEIKVEENKKLTATILPDNTTNKNIIWKSSDENVVAISESGEITGKKQGEAEITASTSNGKKDTIKISVKEEKKAEDNTIAQTVIANTNAISNTTSSDSDSSDTVSAIVALGLLGGRKLYRL